MKPNAQIFDNMTIRESDSEDLDSIVDLWCQLDAHVKGCSADANKLNKSNDYQQYVIKWIYKYLKNSDALLLVSEYQNKIFGFVSAQIQYMPWYSIQRAGLIGPCYIMPSFRRQGIARKMIQQVEFWMSEKQMEYVDVIWDQGNRQAEQFWQSLGYVPVQIRASKSVGGV